MLKPLRVEQWEETLERDPAAVAHSQRAYVPRWLNQLDVMPRTDVFGEDVLPSDLEIVLRTLINLSHRLESLMSDRPRMFIFRLPHTVLVMSVHRRQSRVDAIQLWLDKCSEVRMRRLALNSYDGLSEPPTVVNSPVAPTNWPAAVQLTFDLAQLLLLASPNRQYDTREVVDIIDQEVNMSSAAVYAPSITLLRLFGSDPMDALDLNRGTDSARIGRIVKTAEVARRVTERRPVDAVAAAREAQAAVVPGSKESGGHSLSFEMVCDVAHTWFGARLARMLLQPFEVWPSVYQPGVKLLENGATIEIDEHGRQQLLIGLLRRVRQTMSTFASTLPTSIYPFAVVVTGFSREALAFTPDFDDKEGLLVVYADRLLFTQVGRFESAYHMRRITLATTASGEEHVGLVTLPENAAFGELRGLLSDAVVVQAPARTANADVLRGLVNEGVSVGSVRIGAALAPIIDTALEAFVSGNNYSFADMLGILMFARAVAQAQAGEMPALLKLYRGYTLVLREFIRDVVSTIYGSQALEQTSGSESSSELSEGRRRSSDDTTTQSCVKPTEEELPRKNQRRERVDFTRELKLSRIKRRSQRVRNARAGRGEFEDESEELQRGQREDAFDEDERDDSDDDDGSEEIAQIEKRRRRLEDVVAADEFAEVVVVAAGSSDAALPTDQETSEVATHDIVARLVSDFVSHNHPTELATIQLLDRAFSRQAALIDSKIYAELWANQYPLLALLLAGGEYPMLLEPMRYGLIVRVIDNLHAAASRLEEQRRRLLDALIADERQLTALFGAPETIDRYVAESGMFPEHAHITSLEASLFVVQRREDAMQRLALVRIEYDELTELSELANALIVRLEGRSVVSLGADSLATTTQRQVLYRNRQWTLLMSLFDNMVHHPRVRRELLSKSLQPEFVSRLFTANAEAVDELLETNRKWHAKPPPVVVMVTGNNRVIMDVMNTAGAYEESPSRPRGRYLVGVRNDFADVRNPDGDRTMLAFGPNTTQLDAKGDADWDSHGTPQLLTTQSSPAVWAQNDYLYARDMLRMWEEPLARGVSRVRAEQSTQQQTLVSAEGYNSPRMVTLTAWESVTEIVGTQPPYVLRRMQDEAGRAQPADFWQIEHFKQLYAIVAVDHAVVAGLLALWREIPMFQRNNDAAVTALQEREFNAIATAEVEDLLRVNRMGYGANAGNYYVQSLARSRQQATYIDWMKAVSRTMQEEETPEGDSATASRLWAQIGAVFQRHFGTSAEYAAEVVAAPQPTDTGRAPAPATRVRVFRKLEHEMLQLLFNFLMVSVAHNNPAAVRRHAYTIEINGVGMMLSLEDLLSKTLANKTLRSLLIGGLNRMRVSIGFALDEKAVEATTNLASLQGLVPDLARLGITLE